MGRKRVSLVFWLSLMEWLSLYLRLKIFSSPGVRRVLSAPFCGDAICKHMWNLLCNIITTQQPSINLSNKNTSS
ncbi:hypothetical protein VTJ04DRAFT_4639 [Mycothermus thermophilus]|uniref:uncharacterized protein n=1 Tax=Humicola insolens TaxID=85995 RepID=UPI0037435B2B